MDRLSPDQLDRQLGSWLREESSARAPARLIEDVFARTSRAPQASRWWPPRRDLLGKRRPGWQHAGALGGSAGALAGSIAVVLLAVGLGIAVHQFGIGPGSSATPSPSPAVSAGPPSPAATVLGAVTAERLHLGNDVAPIAVTEAFGSIWVADIHANDVRRFNPATMTEIARIPVPSAAWFAVADGALWVTSQTNTGVSRIDPATNTVVAHVGDVAPCGAPVVAFGSLWQSACDAGVILKIDPVAATVVETIPAPGHAGIGLVGDRLLTTGAEGLARLDPETGTLTAIPSPTAVGGFLIAADSTTAWVQSGLGFVRIDPETGERVATFSASNATSLSISDGHAWLALGGEDLREIDLETNEVTRTIPLGSAQIAFETGDVLWVTDFEHSDLWRIHLS